VKTIMTQEVAGFRAIRVLRVRDQEARNRVARGEAIYVSKAEYKRAYPERKGPAETKGKR